MKSKEKQNKCRHILQLARDDEGYCYLMCTKCFLHVELQYLETKDEGLMKSDRSSAYSWATKKILNLIESQRQEMIEEVKKAYNEIIEDINYDLHEAQWKDQK